MSEKAKIIKVRYERSYVTDTQLNRYLQLSVITQEEYNEIYKIKHPT